jgi:two-component system, chemotaxis family, sensor kinase CheA
VVSVLNVPDVLKSVGRASAVGVRLGAIPVAPTEVPRKSVLVMEDSITARMLLKHLPEAAGYQVMTAVDGVDGFTQLRSGAVDIVVSDVEMPPLNGFDLTAKIRHDRQLADMPVVLVTALESRQDRERSIEVGTNAYIVDGNPSHPHRNCQWQCGYG